MTYAVSQCSILQQYDASYINRVCRTYVDGSTFVMKVNNQTDFPAGAETMVLDKIRVDISACLDRG